MKHFYGVEKCGGDWRVWQFSQGYEDASVLWLEHGDVGSVRWLCSKDTAMAMAGARAMDKDNLIIRED